MVVDSSIHDPGEKARLQLPTMKENDTHCVDFSYLLYSQKGLNPGTLNILVRVNKGPLANPIWNVTGFTGRDWLRAELAVSTFWPNEYQVIIIFVLCFDVLDLAVNGILSKGEFVPLISTSCILGEGVDYTGIHPLEVHRSENSRFGP